MTLPAVPGDARLARHIASSLTSQELDLAMSQHKALDHGCFSPLSMLTLGGAQNLMPLAGIPRNATGLAFGQQIPESRDWIACRLWPISASAATRQHF